MCFTSSVNFYITPNMEGNLPFFKRIEKNYLFSGHVRVNPRKSISARFYRYRTLERPGRHSHAGAWER